MRLFLRTFNPDINSKTGVSLPPCAPRRGTPDWLIFQDLLINSLKELGHELIIQPENPRIEDLEEAKSCDKRIYVHKTFRECPDGDMFWMQMHLRNLFTLDTQGWGADHSGLSRCHLDDIDEFEAEDFVKELSDSLWTSGLSKCAQPERESTTDTPLVPWILVPIQIPRDYTIIHHSPITVKYFIDSIQAWAEETHNHVVFKLHPFNKCDTDIKQAVEDALSSRYVHKAEGNIHELIKRSAGLFVINSGTGFEGLIHGKPVATFGYCDYSRVTFNADIRRIEEARNFIYSYGTKYFKLVSKFIWWYFKSHAFDVKDTSMPERLKHYLSMNL